MTIYPKGFRLGVGILLPVVVGGFLSEVVYSQNTSLKIGSVDIQKAVNECHAGKEAKKTLTKEVEIFQSLIFEKQRDLQAMKESLENQSSILNPENRAARERIIDQILGFPEMGGRYSERDQSETVRDGEKHCYRSSKSDPKAGGG